MCLSILNISKYSSILVAWKLEIQLMPCLVKIISKTHAKFYIYVCVRDILFEKHFTTVKYSYLSYNHKLHQNEDDRTSNVMSAFSWSCVYIDIYFFKYPIRWQKLLGSARSSSTALSYRNCVITLCWRLMRLGYRTCFHTLYDENYKIKNIIFSI